MFDFFIRFHGCLPTKFLPHVFLFVLLCFLICLYVSLLTPLEPWTQPTSFSLLCHSPPFYTTQLYQIIPQYNFKNLCNGHYTLERSDVLLVSIWLSHFKGTRLTGIQCGRVWDFPYMENEVSSNALSQSVSIRRTLQYLHSEHRGIIKRTFLLIIRCVYIFKHKQARKGCRLILAL